MEKKVYSLCEAVADIAYIAGYKNYYGGDSREDIAKFIGWAEEFERLNDGKEWGVDTEEEYIEAIHNFAESKIGA